MIYEQLNYEQLKLSFTLSFHKKKNLEDNMKVVNVNTAREG